MYFGGTDEEDNDFSLGGGGRSRLASLFGSGHTKEEDTPSLKYTAPKQPKKTDSQSSESLAVIHAVVIHAYKFQQHPDGGNYSSQGKLGLVILGSHETSVYKLLMYKGKEQYVTIATIVPTFKFLIQTSNYASFYDDRRDNWSVMFDSEQSAVEFAKQIALAKANIAGDSLSTVIVQDLTPGEGSSLEIGDSAEIKYTGWLFIHHTVGEVFDTNSNAEKLLRLKLGKGKVIKGWEEGLVGGKKNSKRFLIIPPSLGYGSQTPDSRIPPNSTLIFEVFINKVKLAKEVSRSSTPVSHELDPSGGKKPDIPVKPHSDSLSEDTIRARGASISEQLSQSPKTEKARIISRMAKMGMPMLPMHGAVPAQPSSESETEEELHRGQVFPQSQSAPRSRESSPKPVPKPRTGSFGPTVPHLVQTASVQGLHHPQPTIPSSHQVAVFQPQQQQFLPGAPYTYPYQPQPQASPFPAITPQPYHPPSSSAVITSMADTHLPLLLSETRNQNTEVRLSLGKLSDKVDMVIQKLDRVESNQGGVAVHNQIPYMESSVLMSNIQRIVQENNRLKQELDEKSTKIHSLNEKICDLLQRNQKFFEVSNNMLEERSDSLQNTASQSQARLLNMEQERTKLTTELTDAMTKISNLQRELVTYQQQGDDLKQQLQLTSTQFNKQKVEVEALKSKDEENSSMLVNLRQMLKDVKHQKLTMESKLEVLEDKISDMERTKETLEKNLAERKQKLLDERKKAEEEIEEMKTAQEKEIEALRSRLLKQKSVTSSEQMSQLEEDLKVEYEQKRTQMVSEATHALQKEVIILREEKEELEEKVEELQKKINAVQSSHKGDNERVHRLEEMVSDLEQWKTKYEALYERAESMKERYEARIAEMTVQLQSGPETQQPTVNQDFIAELKIVMNSLYRVFQTEFEADHSYLGSDVLQTVLQSIRMVTLKTLEMKNSQKNISDSKLEKIEASPPTTLQMPHLQTEDTTPVQDLKDEKLQSNESDTQEDGSHQIAIESEDSILSSVEEDKPDIVLESVPCQSNAEEYKKDEEESESSSKENLAETITSGVEEKQQTVNHELEETQTKSESVESHEEKTTERRTPEKRKSPLPSFSDALDNEDESKRYLFFDTKAKAWLPQPPPPPLFDDDDDEDEDEWLN